MLAQVFIKVDVSQSQHEALVARFNVTTLPSLSFLRNGEVVRQYVGSDMVKIKDMVRTHLTNGDGTSSNGLIPGTYYIYCYLPPRPTQTIL